MTEQDRFWRVKLDARLHDPIEKPLILMRTAEGHEGGTTRALRDQLGLHPLDPAARTAVKTADHWAAAMDRAAFPNRNEDGRYPNWQQVRFHERPVIINPLTGAEYDLCTLSEVEPDQAASIALDHLRGLIHSDDPKRTALAFWRFGPNIEAPEIRSLWPLLPADSRMPDHTIFDHLDLTSALAGAFSIDPDDGPALLAVSLGPVQDFIAAARSTSDLWAGSHLLARLSWEAMRVICDELGPEAILFPRLRGIPQVDWWLSRDCRLNESLFSAAGWRKNPTDSNPLFAAALPNRFTALVPANRARELAERITDQVRAFALEKAQAAWRKLLAEAGVANNPEMPAHAQIREQLKGFPEVHWATVPWSLVGQDSSGKVDASDDRLRAAMQPYFESEPPGYLGTQAWKILSKTDGVELDKGWFWKPNPGTLYPALHELLDRTLAAAKSARPFGQSVQHGYRDSLTGESEWLTADRDQLALPPGQRNDTIWARVTTERPAWVKAGEHLDALGMLKRLWPTLFVDEVNEEPGLNVDRFVVSTHTMALATSMIGFIQRGGTVPEAIRNKVSDAPRTALPARLASELPGRSDADALFRLPGWLEHLDDRDREDERARAGKELEDVFGHDPEAYYALLLMDGDEMGRWMSAAREKTLTHRSSFHPQIRATLEQFKADPAFVKYADEPRAPNPARHMAISDALNNFAIRLAPAVVERHYGRVLYAGGDDLMAMLPLYELLPAMAGLRAAFSGTTYPSRSEAADDEGFQRQGNGFVVHGKQLLRTMGDQASASCGVVVAHHKAPLGAVLRELRRAEKRAKTEGGRDAFSLTVVKRSGGALGLTAKFGRALARLIQLRDFLAEPGVSRRAVYNT
ncbi:MAG: type III-B CRISPR-associated protein Cas10/Cmr2, partial [Wenzhouxiangellaceae bacterium]|nr:type III-B CRISPR-associated protein Cas10/Cmr2 [Wenzhouxiangellaceae bacterium]